MTSHPLPVSARMVLQGWTAPDASQEILRGEYLAFLDSHVDATWRDCRVGHITASTLIVDTSRESVLLTLHPLVGRWLQTGGHCETDDGSIWQAALREAAEESGIDALDLDETPLRLDRHLVRCRSRDGGMDVLHHLDVQFLVRAPVSSAIAMSEESLELAWWPWEHLPDGVDDSVVALVHAARGRLAVD